MACINCNAGLCWECNNVLDGICCCNRASVNSLPPVAEEDEDDTKNSYRTYKREGTLKDQQSTGRKRAAKAYPLDPKAPCEWRGLKFAGGSRFPIVGCTSGLQQARHHGPDKNTLNNDEGNVHRICHICHNRWHTLNDPSYDAGSSHEPHDEVTQATVDDFVLNVQFWANRSLVKAKD